LKSKQHLEYEKRQAQLNALNATRNSRDDEEKTKQKIAAQNKFLHQFLHRQNQRLLGLETVIDNRVDVANDHPTSTGTTCASPTRSVTQEGVVNRIGVTNTASRQSSRSAVSQKVGIFEIGFHGSDDVMIVPVSASGTSCKSANGEYRMWRLEKEQFETLPTTRNNEHVREITTSRELEGIRKKLLLDGITYEEWLGYKDMARHVSRVQSAN